MNRRLLPFALVPVLAASVLRAGTPLVLGERIQLPSKVMSEERTLYVSLPGSYARTTRLYPVLYLTDAEAQFEHTSATARFLARTGVMPEVIVVGVTNTDRTRDLSPSHDPSSPTSGGADRFLDFFEKELIPFVESGYRTAPFRIFKSKSKGLRWASATYAEENHGSVVLRSHYAALRMIFDGWALPVNPETERIVGTLDEVRKRYADLSERLGWTVTAPEIAVNRLGYQALGQNIPLALTFFRYNAAMYPESANVHDSLGEALEKSGALEDALRRYQKAEELGAKTGDPNAGVFKANAERVRVKLLETTRVKTVRP